ncbi:phospholipase A2 inhibitor and Ly6/PLAUR domain-containing protein-like [Elgaria multicarinata webbii]|uniref:phospholipase A2 inhibitor and Ly6/PLAUR domain-containing protein-like n=1 Tax=Elgaria multicarinata webbii TaxID=159646 RepID=UPI002FCCD3B2
MKALLSICLLLALLSLVASLRCKTCFSCERTCRDEDVRTEECGQDQDVCLSVSTNLTIWQFPFAFTYKGCSRSDECNDGYYIASGVDDRYGQVKSRCCQTDECNVQNMYLPDYNSLKLNGFQCPSCFSTSWDHCDSQERTVQCRGTEDQCIELTFDLSLYGLPKQHINFRGCSNKELCFNPTGKTKYGNGLLVFDYDFILCEKAKGSTKQPETKE